MSGAAATPVSAPSGMRAVVMGASAGAVAALSAILPALPAGFRLPIIVVVHLPAMVAAIKTHLAAAPQRYADLLEAEDLGPEPMRFLDIAHIDHEVVDARRGQRFRGCGRNHTRCPICHR